MCGVHERERVRRSELECGSGVVSERVWTSGLPRFRVSQCATGNRSLGAENVDTLRQFSVSRFSLSASLLLRDTRRHTRTYVYICVCIHIYVCIYYIRSHGTQFIQCSERAFFKVRLLREIDSVLWMIPDRKEQRDTSWLRRNVRL